MISKRVEDDIVTVFGVFRRLSTQLKSEEADIAGVEL